MRVVWKTRIDAMNREELYDLYVNTPLGQEPFSPEFPEDCDTPEYILNRYETLGGDPLALAKAYAGIDDF